MPILSFPLQVHISFVPPRRFSRTQYSRLANEPQSFYHWVQAPYWSRLEQYRVEVAETSHKFRDVDLKSLQTKLPDWTVEDLEALSVVYQTIDLNEDGLIDFIELCAALDEIGDTSSEEERRRYFQAVDLDKSEGLDFEEFMSCVLEEYLNENNPKHNTVELLDAIRSAGASANDGNQTLGLEGLLKHQKYASCIKKVTQLTVSEQLRFGLF